MYSTSLSVVVARATCFQHTHTTHGECASFQVSFLLFLVSESRLAVDVRAALATITTYLQRVDLSCLWPPFPATSVLVYPIPDILWLVRPPVHVPTDRVPF
jgi:hypothetical protein